MRGIAFLSLVSLAGVLAGITVVLPGTALRIMAVCALALPVIVYLMPRMVTLGHRKLMLGTWSVLVCHRAFIPRFSLFSTGDFDPSVAYAEVAITLAVFAVTLGIAVARHPAIRVPRFSARYWLTIYAVFCSLSLAWTPDIYYAGFWLIRLWTTVILINVYFTEASQDDVRRFMVVTLLAMVPYLCLVPLALLGNTLPAASDLRVQAFWVHPVIATFLSNTLGVAILAFLVQQRHAASQVVLLGLAALTCLTLGFLSSGKSGAIGAGVALFIMLVILPRTWRWLITAAATGFIIASFFVTSLPKVGLIAHLLLPNPLESTYVRFGVWALAVDRWTLDAWSLFFGHGYAATYTSAILHTADGFPAVHAHNSVLQALIEVGLVGGAPLFLLVLAVASTVGRLIVFEHRWLVDAWVFPFVIAFVVLFTASVVDDVFGSGTRPQLYLFLSLAIGIDEAVRRERSAPVAPVYA